MELSPAENAQPRPCDQEPIHVPGRIQPHGILLALSPDKFIVQQASANAPAAFGRAAKDLVGLSLRELLGAADPAVGRVIDQLHNASIERNPTPLGTCQVGHGSYDLIGHSHDGVIVVEMEQSGAGAGLSGRNLYLTLRGFVAELRGVANVQTLAQMAAEEARRLTSFDRAMVYRFDEEWNGVVIAESRDAVFPPYLDLHFPASDIPAQARRLYELNSFRLIANVNDEAVAIVPPINPRTGRPLDLSYAHLRSVSPIHVEYLKNMSVTASMSISLFRGARLWGLIACHNKRPVNLTYEVRTACEFLGQVMSVQLEEKLRNEEISDRISLRSLQATLLTAMSARENFVEGLLAHPEELMNFAGASGAAVVLAGQITRVGTTPDDEQIQGIVDFLAGRGEEEVFSTDALPLVYPPAAQFSERASGLLAISISKLHRSHILWFRPEVIYTVNWSGDPHKAMEPTAARFSPRKSFEIWKQIVHQKSIRFRPSELEAAAQLRNGIVGIVLRNAEELAAINAELKQSNKELEAFSYSVSHDLRAPFRHISSYAELLLEQLGDTLEPTHKRWMLTIVDSSQYAGKLVDNLLNFSQMGRAALHLRPVNMNLLVSEVVAELMRDEPDRNLEWTIRRLPNVVADPTMLRLVWQNLLSNALKYTRGKTPARVEVDSTRSVDDSHLVFSVRDNGIGFDMTYVGKLFGVFQRLHLKEDFEGTGIGLANVRRIIMKHGGRTWAEGKVDAGATFYFSLPPADEARFVTTTP